MGKVAGGSQPTNNTLRKGSQFLSPLLYPGLKKVRKTTRPFRYDLNQNSYNYTVEVTDRFKGLGLVEKNSYRTMDRGSQYCTGGGDQNHPQEKETQNGKMVV